jgi:hypothetical protein
VIKREIALQSILNLWPGYRSLLEHIQVAFLSEDGFSILEENFEVPPESLWQSAVEQTARPPLPFDSRILAYFPSIFANHREFCGGEVAMVSMRKNFTFDVDGHANTLTVILDTNGNIFGGFTPVKWDSNGGLKADDTLESFVFTLKNPHDVPPMRFELKDEKKREAIICDSGWGPCFGDFAVSENCDTNSRSYTRLGNAYVGYTDVEPCIVFSDSFLFQVKEIEVFEITYETEPEAQPEPEAEAE